MIRLQNVRLSFPHFQLLMESAELGKGITGIFGPSGAGKTTLLEIIAGIRRPDSAIIEMNGDILTDTFRRIQIPIEHREIGYVPQDLALFPHLSVQKNLLFGVHQNGRKQDFDHIVSVLDIGNLLRRGIGNLSGGEKQRVAFARALLASPRLLMLDEPLASLDHTLKNRMIEYLLHISTEFHTPMIYVSHDATEMTQLCEQVLMMNEGRIIETGSPSELFKRFQK